MAGKPISNYTRRVSQTGRTGPSAWAGDSQPSGHSDLEWEEEEEDDPMLCVRTYGITSSMPPKGHVERFNLCRTKRMMDSDPEYRAMKETLNTIDPLSARYEPLNYHKLRKDDPRIFKDDFCGELACSTDSEEPPGTPCALRPKPKFKPPFYDHYVVKEYFESPCIHRPRICPPDECPAPEKPPCPTPPMPPRTCPAHACEPFEYNLNPLESYERNLKMEKCEQLENQESSIVRSSHAPVRAPPAKAGKPVNETKPSKCARANPNIAGGMDRSSFSPFLSSRMRTSTPAPFKRMDTLSSRNMDRSSLCPFAAFPSVGKSLTSSHQEQKLPTIPMRMSASPPSDHASRGVSKRKDLSSFVEEPSRNIGRISTHKDPVLEAKRKPSPKSKKSRTTGKKETSQHARTVSSQRGKFEIANSPSQPGKGKCPPKGQARADLAHSRQLSASASIPKPRFDGVIEKCHHIDPHMNESDSELTRYPIDMSESVDLEKGEREGCLPESKMDYPDYPKYDASMPDPTCACRCLPEPSDPPKPRYKTKPPIKPCPISDRQPCGPNPTGESETRQPSMTCEWGDSTWDHPSRMALQTNRHSKHARIANQNSEKSIRRNF